jgi:DNA-directed RNA polymerase subunit omega
LLLKKKGVFMARVTVEDCIEVVPNRFELVLLASRRARDIASGSALAVQRDNDKNPVVALREISEECLPLDQIRQSIIKNMQRAVFIDSSKNFEEEITDEMHPESTWNADEMIIADQDDADDAEDEVEEVSETD